MVLNDTVVDSKTGSYTLPKGIDESWFTSIKSTKNSEKDEQEEYNEEIDKELKEVDKVLKEIDNIKNEEDEAWWNQPAKEDIFDKITDWLTGDKKNSKTQGEEVFTILCNELACVKRIFGRNSFA